MSRFASTAAVIAAIAKINVRAASAAVEIAVTSFQSVATTGLNTNDGPRVRAHATVGGRPPLAPTVSGAWVSWGTTDMRCGTPAVAITSWNRRDISMS